VRARLIAQSQDAALAGIQVFNNPLIRFKSETFIVLMIISWTYLLHAFCRQKGIEYRYFQMRGGRRHFIRSGDGGFKYWELTACVDAEACPLDNGTKQNLRFLIGLRNEITHHMSPVLDQFVSARYQACCLNYNRYLVDLFGKIYAIDQHLSYSLQLQLTMHSHTELWRSHDAKNPAKGLGVQIASTWYWYAAWIEIVRKHCQDNAARYR